MPNRWLSGLWILLVIAASLIYSSNQPSDPWIIPALIVMWMVTLASILPPSARQIVSVPLRWLRGVPVLYWLFLLLFICVGLGLWIVTQQPTNGRWLTPMEVIYLLAFIWGFLLIVAYDVNREQARAMGAKLSKSKFTGVLLMLTTFALIFIGAETWMRIFYITTDAYTFTAMNYHWYNNFYWGHFNSVGYRDYEPNPDATTRIAVVGDSFAAGHGINNIDDTFPQLLERSLGTDYDVNVIAQSGWDTDSEEAYLDTYPYRPNIVILSYYLNDISYLIRANVETNPDANFSFPENPTLNWIVLNFFVPNYIYYNLLQFTSTTRTTNHTDDLVSAHTNDTYWIPQSERLASFVNWTQTHDARLIVLLWPHVTMVDQSAPAIERLRTFFTELGIEVVDMSDYLRGQDPNRMIVNRFDTHPGIEANRLAAEALFAVITQNP